MTTRWSQTHSPHARSLPSPPDLRTDLPRTRLFTKLWWRQEINIIVEQMLRLVQSPGKSGPRLSPSCGGLKHASQYTCTEELFCLLIFFNCFIWNGGVTCYHLQWSLMPLPELRSLHIYDCSKHQWLSAPHRSERIDIVSVKSWCYTYKKRG